MNYGYGILRPDNLDENYQSAVEKGAELVDGATPFFSEFNQSHVKLYLKDEESTYSLVYEVNTGSNQVNIIQKRGYLVVPNGFEISKLLSKENLEEIEFKNIDAAIKEGYEQHISGAIVAFAQKTV